MQVSIETMQDQIQKKREHLIRLMRAQAKMAASIDVRFAAFVFILLSGLLFSQACSQNGKPGEGTATDRRCDSEAVNVNDGGTSDAGDGGDRMGQVATGSRMAHLANDGFPN